MSLPKIDSKFLLIIFLIFTNFWIYKIFKTDILIGVIVVVCSVAVSLLWERKGVFKILSFCLLVLLILQYLTTESKSLTLLDNDEQRVQQERIRSYPPTYINLFIKTVWLKPDKWIEQNSLVIGLSRMEENLFENLDLNRYFFGGFPRNKPADFEKFTFFLIPLFIIGIYKIIRDKKSKILLLLFIPPLIMLSYIGNKNNLGSFVLLPGFFISFIAGVNLSEGFFKRRKLLHGLIILAVVLGFILQISYGSI